MEGNSATKGKARERQYERKRGRRTKRVRRMERGDHKKKCKDEQSKSDSV